jgi:hypothetical protein
MLNQTLCTSFKAQVLLGVHDFRVSGGDTFKLALYTSLADLGAATTQYTATGEVSGTNYTAGGIVLTNLGVSSDNTAGAGFTSFATATFTNVTLTARGGLIYNTTPSALANDGTALTNPAVCVLDFGEDKTFTAQNMVVTFPLNSSTDAIIRIAQ